MAAAEASMGHPKALPAEDARKSVSTDALSPVELLMKLHTPCNKCFQTQMRLYLMNINLHLVKQ